MNKISLEKYREMLEKLGVSEEDLCYNAEIDDCNGACQGCSDCILAQHYRDDIKNKPSRNQMMLSRIRNIIITRELERFIEQVMSDEDFRRETKIIIDKLLSKSNEEEIK